MFARRSARIAPTLLLVLVLVVPLGAGRSTPVGAQSPFPPRLAEEIAACMTVRIGDALTGPAWVEEAPTPGWRVALPLRGQPAAQRPGAQSLPPATDTVAWIDLHQYPTPSQVPADIDNLTSYIMVTATGETYAVYHGGYYWLALRNASQACFESAVPSRMWPI